MRVAARPRARRRPEPPAARSRPDAAVPGYDVVMSPEPAVRVAALSYFFPAHNEAENLEALVEEALVALPAIAERFEIIAVDDGSRDATPAIAERLAAAAPPPAVAAAPEASAPTTQPGIDRGSLPDSVSFSVAACVNMMTRSSWPMTGASASACPEESTPARKSAPQLSTK